MYEHRWYQMNHLTLSVKVNDFIFEVNNTKIQNHTHNKQLAISLLLHSLLMPFCSTVPSHSVTIFHSSGWNLRLKIVGGRWGTSVHNVQHKHMLSYPLLIPWLWQAPILSSVQLCSVTAVIRVNIWSCLDVRAENVPFFGKQNVQGKENEGKSKLREGG